MQHPLYYKVSLYLIYFCFQKRNEEKKGNKWWMVRKKGGGDNGEKCRKQQRGKLDCRQRPFTLPPHSTSPRKHHCHFVCISMCVWKMSSLSLP